MGRPKSATKKSQKRSEPLAAINRLGQLLTTVQDSAQPLFEIARAAQEVLEADIVDLYEYHHANQEFITPPIMIGERLRPEIAKSRIYDDDVVVKVVRLGRAEYYADAQTDRILTSPFEIPRADRPDERFVIREKVISSVAIPLLGGGETVGVMFVNYRKRQPFTDAQKYLIESFSNLAAIAIHNARLWKSQSQQLSELREIIDVIGTMDDPLSIILEKTVHRFSANYGSVSRLTEEGNLQHRVVWNNRQMQQAPYDAAITHPINKGITGHVVRTGTPFRTGDVRQVEFYDEWYPDTESEMAFPLRNAFGGIIGVLNLESKFANFFTEENEQLCASFASAASAAIQQSDLIDSIQALHYLTETRTLRELLDIVLRNLNRMVGKNTASSVNLYDTKNDNYYAFYGIGPDETFASEYLLVPPRRDGIGRHVLKTRAPLFYDDVNTIPVDFPKVRPESERFAVVSLAALPLVYQNDVVGALYIHKVGERVTFTENARRILETYASQAAIAIHNAQSLIDFASLKDVLGATVSKGRDEILELIVRKAVDIMPSDYASIWMPEEENGDLVSQAIYVRPEAEDAFIVGRDRIPRDRASINVSVYQDKRPIIVSDVSKAEEEGRYHRIYQKAKSELAVPLVFGPEVIGTLNMESQHLGAYSEFDVATLQMFADVAAVAIVNTRTYAQRVKDIAALEEINGAIGQKPLQEIYELIAQKAKELTNAAYSTLWLLDETKRQLKVGAVFGRDALEQFLPLNDQSINGHVILTRTPYICGDAGQDPHYHQWYRDILSNLTVPIAFHEQLIGSLHVESSQPAAYDESHKRLLQSLADQAAIALRLAQNIDELRKTGEQLYHMNYRLERRNASFEALTEIGQQLTANIQRGEKEILSIIQEQASHLMDTNNMYVALYEPEKDRVQFALAFLNGQPVDIENIQGWEPRVAGHGRTEWIIRHRSPILTYTKADAEQWYKQPDAVEYIGQPFASWVGVPIMIGDEVLGVIATYNEVEEYIYDPDDLKILKLMGRQAAIALQNARLVRRLNAIRDLGDDLNKSALAA